MKKEIMVAGFGGQGVMAIGKALVEAGMAEGLEVTWVPSYGPEMRGGTSNCSVILSDREIGSPVVYQPTELIAMNQPSLEKFKNSVQPGGLIFINAGTTTTGPLRDDVTVYRVPCDEMAQQLGNARVANMIMLGAYAAATSAVGRDTLVALIHHMFSDRKAHLADINVRALDAGISCIRA